MDMTIATMRHLVTVKRNLGDLNTTSLHLARQQHAREFYTQTCIYVPSPHIFLMILLCFHRPWYRNAKYGGASHIPPAIAGLRFESKGSNNQPPGKFLYHYTGESQSEMDHSSNLIKGSHEEVRCTPRTLHIYIPRLKLKLKM
jgi:hypothetical protein